MVISESTVVVTIILVPICEALVYRPVRGKLAAPNAGKTMCGWCGHELRGISTPRCPECGHRVGDRGPDENGTLPRGRRRRRWIARLALAALVYFLGASVEGGLKIKLGLPKSYTSFYAPYSAFFLLQAFAFGTFALMPNLVLYERYLRFDHSRSGRAWCRECRHELRDLIEPKCPACGENI